MATTGKAWISNIHHGDCIEGLRKVPHGSVDLVFADPPFNIGYEYDVYDDQREHQEYISWSNQWISAVHDVLSPNGTFWLAIGDEYAAELKVESQKIGFHCRSWVIWYYTFGVNSVSFSIGGQHSTFENQGDSNQRSSRELFHLRVL